MAHEDRIYQFEALDAVDAAHAEGKTRPTVILPTGAGKTIVFSMLVSRRVSRGDRVVILVHRDELVRQTVAKLQMVDPTLSVGIVQADSDDTTQSVTVCSVQTLFRADRLARVAAIGAGLVVVDELHHYTATVYRRVLEGLGVFDGTLAAGFTATFTRTDSAHLSNDWTVVYEKTTAWAIEHGYLVDLDAISVRVPDLDLTATTKSGGDYTDKSLGDAVSKSSAADIIPAAWRKYAEGRPTILFAPTIASCEDLANGLRLAGIKTECVYGGTPTEERQAIYTRVRNGVTQVLASVGVLTEGFDEPSIACAILARPTKSTGLFQQMVGRVLRLFPGKTNAVLLDIVGATDELDLANVTDLTRDHDGNVDASLESQPTRCGCSDGCCNVDRLRGTCTQAKNAGVCGCGTGCVCPTSGERGAIKLVAGAEDVHVDLFSGSSSVWLKTYGGTWFIPTATHLFTVLPVGPGEWAAARTHSAKVAWGPDGGWLMSAPADLTTAMTVAQDAALAEDSTLASKTAKWRRGRPSDGQLDLVSRLGIKVPDGLRKGPVSDAISIHFGSSVLD